MKFLRNTGLLFIALAAACGLSEAFFYGGDLNAEGYIQESLFLPLTFLFAFLATSAFVAMLVVVGVQRLRR